MIKKKGIITILFAIVGITALSFGIAGCANNKKHTHTYNQKVAEENYLKNKADCIHNAVYYYSCACGEKGTETFEYGSVDDYAHIIVENECVICHEKVAKLTYGLNKDGTSYYVSGIEENLGKLVVIPSIYEKKPVTGIGESAFNDCHSLTSLTIPESITSIGDYAFGDCWELKKIIIPDSVITIGDRVFFNCFELDSITIGKGVTNIGETIFDSCVELKNIIVKKGNKKFHSNGNCLIETEKRNLICGCKNSVIPTDGSVTAIGENAFHFCLGLESISIPDDVTKIEGNPFAFCFNLEFITVENGNIKYHSEDNCLIETESKTLIAGCKNSIIPNDDSVTSIGKSAFEASGISNITIPHNITIIGSNAFSQCPNITSVTIPDSVTEIGESAFYFCSVLLYCEAESQPKGWDSGWNLYAVLPIIWNCKKNNKDENGYFYTEISGIRYALKNGEAVVDKMLSNNTSVTIPEKIYFNGISYNVTNISNWAFIDYLSDELKNYPDSLFNIIYSSFYNCCFEITNVTLPNSIKSINHSAFYNCDSLATITFKGTIDQWQSIEKDKNWNYNTSNFTIQCTDGKLDKDGNIIV